MYSCPKCVPYNHRNFQLYLLYLVVSLLLGHQVFMDRILLWKRMLYLYVAALQSVSNAIFEFAHFEILGDHKLPGRRIWVFITEFP